jgi:hypothetical protein
MRPITDSAIGEPNWVLSVTRGARCLRCQYMHLAGACEPFAQARPPSVARVQQGMAPDQRDVFTTATGTSCAKLTQHRVLAVPMQSICTSLPVFVASPLCEKLHTLLRMEIARAEFKCCD